MLQASTVVAIKISHSSSVCMYFVKLKKKSLRVLNKPVEGKYMGSNIDDAQFFPQVLD